MRTMNLGRTKAQVPVIAVGCMRLNGLEEREAERFINGAMVFSDENRKGINCS